MPEAVLFRGMVASLAGVQQDDQRGCLYWLQQGESSEFFLMQISSPPKGGQKWERWLVGPPLLEMFRS